LVNFTGVIVNILDNCRLLDLELWNSVIDRLLDLLKTKVGALPNTQTRASKQASKPLIQIYFDPKREECKSTCLVTK